MKTWLGRWSGMVVAVVVAVVGAGMGASAVWGQSVSLSFEGKDHADVSAATGGRVVVFLIGPGAKVRRGAEPREGFFEGDPQPMFGVEVNAWKAGEALVVGPGTVGFLGEGGVSGRAGKVWGVLGELPAGVYRVQAALITNRERDWRACAGNLYSKVAMWEVGQGGAKTVALKLTERTEAAVWPREARGEGGAEEFVMRSEVLSRFWGREMFLRAGVRFPTKMTAGGVGKRYAAVYEVPGFGGDDRGALRPGDVSTAAGRRMAEETFYIVLDPGSPYGHTFFMDSHNIGPWGTALTQELIPALEKKYALVARPEARLLRGHSSGGWSALWLATAYPEVFGAAWSSSPDPVDFRRLERVDLYGRSNFYSVDGVETPSARMTGNEPTMTVRQENAMEEVLGPGYTSAQQWTSWQACWGTRRMRPDGTWTPTPLYDVVTGVIDKKEAETYRRFDLADRLRKDPKRFVPLFRNNVRLIVGTRDDYYLNEAVALLKADLERLDPGGKGGAGGKGGKSAGYIKLVEGAGHGSIYGSAEMRAFAGEMVEHLVGAGVMEKEAGAGAATRP